MLIIQKNNGILTYHFVEKPVIASLVVSGYGAGKEQKQIDREIGLKKGDVYDANTIASVRRRITRLLEAQGFYDSVVEVKTEEISKYIIIIFCILIVLFTFCPPKIGLFKDNVKSTYGIFEVK